MADFAITEQHNIVTSGRTVSTEIPHSAPLQQSISESVAAEGSVVLTIGFDKDVLVFGYLLSDVDVTVKLRDAAAETVLEISLAAGVPWTWRTGDVALSDDVASILIENASLTDAAAIDGEIMLESGTGA